MTTKERILKLHEAICKCPTCKGETNNNKLCASCKTVDGLIDELEKKLENQVEKI